MCAQEDPGIEKTVLLIDDEAHLRRLVAVTLQDSRYRFLEAASGKEGLEIARREKPDLILLDIAMPEMNGFDVCRRLKADPETRDTAIVMLTAMAQEADRLRGWEVGADGYFTKPFSPMALLDKVGEVLAL